MGSEMCIRDSVDTENTRLLITQRLIGANNGGTIFVPYAQYNGGFSLRLLENENDTVTEGKIAVCNGESWDAQNKTSNGSSATVNSITIASTETGNSVHIVDFSINHKIYIKTRWGRGGYRGDVLLDVISTKENLNLTETGVYGYTLISALGKQLPPYGGMYNVFLFNVGCDTNYSIIQPESDEQI